MRGERVRGERSEVTGGGSASRVPSHSSLLTPSRLSKAGVFMLCLAPLGVMIFDALTGHLAAEPIKDLTHRTGLWGLTFVTATLAVTPLRRVSGWNRLASYRRMLGLFAFFYLGLHFLVYLVLDQFFDWHTIAKDITKRPYITVGFTGLLLMVPLAVTSTRGWIRRLGRRWNALHALVYVTALAGVVHFTWSQKADLTLPTRYAIVLAVLLAARLVPRGAFARRGARAGAKAADDGTTLAPAFVGGPAASQGRRAGPPLVPGIESG
jgi:methionine sulfoxide reductase heme-binding subunit